jgi:hypothetical protein
MKNSYLFLAVILFPNLSLTAWQPAGWVYNTWPYAYEANSGDWYFILESGTQWVYSYPPGSGEWHRIEDSPLRDGWSWYQWPNAHGPLTNHWHLLNLTETQWAANMTTEAWSQFGHPVPLDPLLTEEIYYRITQNGNLNNEGLAIFDRERERHLYSVGSSIKSYDPATRMTATVLDLEGNGRPTYLNISYDDLYFIESQKGWLMRFNMVDESLEVVREGKHRYAANEQSYLHLIFREDETSDSWTVSRMTMSRDSLTGSPIRDIEHLNLTSSRYWYTQIGETTLQVCHSGSGSGRTTGFKFGDRGFTGIREMVLDPYAEDSYKPLMAAVLENPTTVGLYLLKVTGPDEGDPVLVAEAIGNTLHSIAYDGTYFYFINGATDPAIYRVHKETQVVEKVLDVGPDVENLNFANHWLYYGKKDSSRLFRVHPVSRKVEVLD